jgi:acetolactate synthase-1/2/3 large subunit
MKVSDVLVRCLENEGVRHVFGVPGEENEDLLFSLAQSRIRFVPTRHEQGAAFIADVWGRLTGRAGVCLSTLGPGATNLVTGIADAKLDKSPLVALTAQGGTERLHHESHQNLDVVSLLRTVTKWNAAVTSPDAVTEIVRKAFQVAEEEKPGPTHIELSEDVAKRETTRAEPLPRVRVRRPAPDYKALAQTVRLLRRAQRPLFLAGNGAIRKLASGHLRRLAERHGIPVVSTFMGKGAVSDRSEQSLWTIGLGFKDYVMEAVERADLILAVGYDVAEYAPAKWNPRADKRIIHIDFQSAEVYAQYRPDVEVVCDVSAALWELAQHLAHEPPPFDREWYKPIRRRIVEDVASYGPVEGKPFTIPGTLNVVREVLDDDGLLLSDVGSHKMWIARNFPTCCAGGCIISNGLAAMGIALPGGIAAALAHPQRQVVAAMGDGGFLMNSQELETARRLGAGFTCLVFNDNDYGLISWKQRMSRGHSVSTHIGNPDFKKYAESFGIRAYRPESVAELRAQLRAAVSSRELCLVEVPVNAGVNVELVAKLKQYWQ